MAIDQSKLKLLQTRLQGKVSAHRGIYGEWRDAADDVKAVRTDLVSRLPDGLAHLAAVSSDEMVEALEAVRSASDPRNPTLRNLLMSAKNLRDAEARRDELAAQAERLQRALVPLQTLVAACEAFAGTHRTPLIS